MSDIIIDELISTALDEGADHIDLTEGQLPQWGLGAGKFAFSTELLRSLECDGPLDQHLIVEQIQVITPEPVQRRLGIDEVGFGRRTVQDSFSFAFLDRARFEVQIEVLVGRLSLRLITDV